ELLILREKDGPKTAATEDVEHPVSTIARGVRRKVFGHRSVAVAIALEPALPPQVRDTVLRARLVGETRRAQRSADLETLLELSRERGESPHVLEQGSALAALLSQENLVPHELDELPAVPLDLGVARDEILRPDGIAAPPAP